jgi:hypothetical protein
MTDMRFLLMKITEFEFLFGGAETEKTPFGMFATAEEAEAKARELKFDDFDIFELKADGTFELL